MEQDSINLKKILCVDASSDADGKSGLNRVTYSKDHLMILKKNPPCHVRPDCLLPDYFNEDNLWDPEKWHRSLSPTFSITRGLGNIESRRRRLDSEDLAVDSNVVLGPQRRSFQGGCHVATKEKTTPTSAPVFSRPLPSNLKMTERGITVVRQQSLEPESQPHQLKRFHSLQPDHNDWTGRDYDKRGFDKSDNSFSRKSRGEYKKYMPPNPQRRQYDGDYSSSRMSKKRGGIYEEEEPEWISYGPNSQSDTIELAGFENEPDDFSWMGGEIPMDDVPERKNKNKNNENREKQNTPVFKELSDLEAEIIEPPKNSTEEKPQKDIPEEIQQTSNGKDEELKKPTVNDGQQSDPNENEENSEDQNTKSRFSRWFNNNIDEIQSKGVDALLNEPPEENTTPSQNIPTTTDQSNSVSSSADLKLIQKSAGTSDLHGTDAFNRLIASIRKTDQVKEQLEQRNQKMQALQKSIMNSSQSQNTSSCFNLSSIESASDSFNKGQQSNSIKLQLEKQKDAYDLKLRQIEQQKHTGKGQYQGQDAMFMGSQQNKFSLSNGVIEERAAATASLAAKLAGKKKEEPKHMSNSPDMERLYSSGSNQPHANQYGDQQTLEEKLQKLKRLQSAPAGLLNDSMKLKSAANMPAGPMNNLKNVHQHESALIIAQMLAKAGVTEEQLKQLTVEQQEMVISMVQNQYTQKDIDKLLEIRTNAKISENNGIGSRPLPKNSSMPNMASLGNSMTGLDLRQLTTGNLTKSQNSVFMNEQAPSTVPTYTDNVLLNDAASAVYRQSANLGQPASTHRVLPQNIMSIHPSIISPALVPHLVTPNLAQHIIPPGIRNPVPHMMHAVPRGQSLHPAILLQMQQQQQQIYAAQQQALAAALQKQQMAAQHDLSKLQQNMRMGNSRQPPIEAGAGSQFNNPLLQWFSREDLRQSQFPPVSQLTGQSSKFTNPNLDLGKR